MMKMPVHNALLESLGPVFAVIFVALLFIQWKWPLRHQHFSALRRLVRNGILAAPGLFVSRLILVPIPFIVSIWASQHHFGFFNIVHLPAVIAIVAGVLLYDYAYYWWHKFMHLAPFFWRFHNVHHTALDMDVSTASRFHLGEVLFSIFFRVAVVGALGLSIRTLAVYEVIFSIANQFQHSNWRLPIGLERALNVFFVTPRMHGIHHSIVQPETNSNWGTVFRWWDQVHRTLRIDIPQDALTIGVAAYRDESELSSVSFSFFRSENRGRGNCRTEKFPNVSRNLLPNSHHEEKSLSRRGRACDDNGAALRARHRLAIGECQNSERVP